MAFLGIGKKKVSVPDELPDLISDEIEKESNTELGNFLKEKESATSSQEIENNKKSTNKKDADKLNIEEKKDNKKTATREEINRRKEVIDRLIEGTKKEEMLPVEDHDEKGFFNDLQEDLSKDSNNLEGLEELSNKLSSRNSLKDMKSYWEKQKSVAVLESMNKSFHEKISKKTELLQSLEREWQKIYFELIEKEEKIRDGEKELKETLREFVKVYKDKKSNLDNETGRNNFNENNEKKNKSKNKNKFENKEKNRYKQKSY